MTPRRSRVPETSGQPDVRLDQQPEFTQAPDCPDITELHVGTGMEVTPGAQKQLFDSTTCLTKLRKRLLS
jgi:hypothetical protein